MSGETKITISGNLTADPKPGLSRTGDTWASLRVASSSRVFDRAEEKYRDGETVFLDVTCWRRLADNVTATLERGDSVVVTGRLRQRSYEDSQAVKHTVIEIVADAVAADLSRCAARLQRTSSAGTRDDREPEASEAPEIASELAA